MDPKEYRKVFRSALSLIRDLEKASGATFPLLSAFELAYEAEMESTEALQLEVAELTEKVGKLTDQLDELRSAGDDLFHE